MNYEQMSLVKRSWKILQQVDPELLGGLFYDKLFTDHPQLGRLFKGDVQVQSRKLIDMISMIVMHSDRLHEVADDIHALAQRHRDYGVKDEYYGYVGHALLWTLQQGLGIDWTPGMAEAWSACLRRLTRMMLDPHNNQTEI